MHLLLLYLYEQQRKLFVDNGFFPPEVNPVQPKHTLHLDVLILRGHIAVGNKYIHDRNKALRNTI
jgi:hypothetical protein